MAPHLQGGIVVHRLPADGGGRVAALGKKGVLVPEHQVANLAGRVVLWSSRPGSRRTVSRACSLGYAYISLTNLVEISHNKEAEWF